MIFLCLEELLIFVFLSGFNILVFNIGKIHLECHKNCGACCIVISISSPLPNMPEGKPAGIRCKNLDENNLCTIHDKSFYPEVCKNFKMNYETCGDNPEFAFRNLSEIEKITKPNNKYF